MLLALVRIIFASLPSLILNILISRGGSGNLLRQVDELFSSKTIHKDFTFSSFALISSNIFLSSLVSFYLGYEPSWLTKLIIIEFEQDSLSSWPCSCDTFDP